MEDAGVERVRHAARLMSAVLHRLGGSVQTLTNTTFIARQRVGGGGDLQGVLDGIDAPLEEIRNTFARLATLPRAAHRQAPFEIALGQVLERALSGLQGGAGRVHARASDPGARIRCDGHAVVVALSELIKNALESSPPEAPVEVEATLKQQELHLVVRDRGAAAWPTPPEGALDPLYTTKSSVLGVGLSIACLVASAHGGALELGRLDHGGARVKLSIPDKASSGEGAL